jgi:VIT1/CCC1 family predicted Fe2+/Mn2+ transporter
MLTAALGCNLAWGLSDAVTYLVSTAVERQRHVALLHRIQATGDPTEAHRLIAAELPESLGADAGADALEALRQRLLVIPAPGAGLGFRDVAGAVGVFALVVLATFPVVVPFLVFKETGLALRVSNGLALATLFAGGFFLGRYAGGSPWRYGLALTGIGVVMVAVIIALGG